MSSTSPTDAADVEAGANGVSASDGAHRRVQRERALADLLYVQGKWLSAIHAVDGETLGERSSELEPDSIDAIDVRANRAIAIDRGGRIVVWHHPGTPTLTIAVDPELASRPVRLSEIAVELGDAAWSLASGRRLQDNEPRGELLPMTESGTLDPWRQVLAPFNDAPRFVASVSEHTWIATRLGVILCYQATPVLSSLTDAGLSVELEGQLVGGLCRLAFDEDVEVERRERALIELARRWPAALGNHAESDPFGWRHLSSTSGQSERFAAIEAAVTEPLSVAQSLINREETPARVLRAARIVSRRVAFAPAAPSPGELFPAVLGREHWLDLLRQRFSDHRVTGPHATQTIGEVVRTLYAEAIERMEALDAIDGMVDPVRSARAWRAAVRTLVQDPAGSVAQGAEPEPELSRWLATAQPESVLTELQRWIRDPETSAEARLSIHRSLVAVDPQRGDDALLEAFISTREGERDVIPHSRFADDGLPLLAVVAPDDETLGLDLAHLAPKAALERLRQDEISGSLIVALLAVEQLGATSDHRDPLLHWSRTRWILEPSWSGARFDVGALARRALSQLPPGAEAPAFVAELLERDIADPELAHAVHHAHAADLVDALIGLIGRRDAPVRARLGARQLIAAVATEDDLLRADKVLEAIIHEPDEDPGLRRTAVEILAAKPWSPEADHVLLPPGRIPAPTRQAPVPSLTEIHGLSLGPRGDLVGLGRVLAARVAQAAEDVDLVQLRAGLLADEPESVAAAALVAAALPTDARLPAKELARFLLPWLAEDVLIPLSVGSQQLQEPLSLRPMAARFYLNAVARMTGEDRQLALLNGLSAGLEQPWTGPVAILARVLRFFAEEDPSGLHRALLEPVRQTLFEAATQSDAAGRITIAAIVRDAARYSPWCRHDLDHLAVHIDVI